MYALDATVASLWRELLLDAARRAGVPAQWIDHAAPAPLHELWQRDDLACVFICGFPWATWRHAAARPLALAAPIPRGQPRSQYASDIVVRADSAFETIEDLFGQRMAWTVDDSQSGYQALRAWLAPRAKGGVLFSTLVGPLVTPRRVIDAVLAGEADAGPLDSYFHALLRRHEPGRAAQLRSVASTQPTPMPLLVASASMPEAECERLARALIDCGRRTDSALLLDALCLDGFEAVEAEDYRVLAERAAVADRLGYARLQ
jgi:ABC-type phosphate/phosphonate transport system substrate-binding protein